QLVERRNYGILARTFESPSGLKCHNWLCHTYLCSFHIFQNNLEIPQFVPPSFWQDHEKPKRFLQFFCNLTDLAPTPCRCAADASSPDCTSWFASGLHHSNVCVPCVIAPPARSAAAIRVVSASSCSLAPAFLAFFEWISMQ